MKKQFMILTAGIILMTTSLYAQQHNNKRITLGIATGINLQKISTNYPDGQTVNTQFIPGFHIGGNAGFRISSHLSLQSGLLFTTKGDEEQEDTYGQPAKLKIHLSYIEIPANLLYRLSLGKGSLLFGAGPYFAVGVGGKRKSHFFGNQSVNFKNQISVNTHHTQTYFKRTDAGANLITGYEFRNGISFKITAQQGFTKINPKYTDYDFGKYSRKNTGFSFSLGYNFF